MYIRVNETKIGEGPQLSPVLTLDKLKIDGIPEITLTRSSSGQYEGFFRTPPSSYNGSVKLSGRVQIDGAGTRRNYSYGLDHSRWPLAKAEAHVGVGGPIAITGGGAVPINQDGSFITSTWMSYKPYLVRHLTVQVTVGIKNGGSVVAKAVVELIDLAGFLAIVDREEKARPAWQTHLHFLASVRKIYHGGPREPQFIGPFNIVLYRHRNVSPLFALHSPAEERLRLYKILYDNGELLEIGHVLCGIEGSPKQKPDQDQQLPKPHRPDLIVTWSGDLGSALHAFIRHFWLATDKAGNAIDEHDPLTLEYYLVKEASRSDLIGDIDGINVGSAYDHSRSLAENLNAYYGKKSLRRFHEFIANSRNERGIAELALIPGQQTPKLSKQARQTIAYYTNQYLIYLRFNGQLYQGPEPIKRARVDKMIEKDSPEMEKVVDHFVSFLENGLTLEQRQGVRP